MKVSLCVPNEVDVCINDYMHGGLREQIINDISEGVEVMAKAGIEEVAITFLDGLTKFAYVSAVALCMYEIIKLIYSRQLTPIRLGRVVGKYSIGLLAIYGIPAILEGVRYGIERAMGG